MIRLLHPHPRRGTGKTALDFEGHGYQCFDGLDGDEKASNRCLVREWSNQHGALSVSIALPYGYRRFLL